MGHASHPGSHSNGRKVALDEAGIAIGRPPHAENDVWLQVPDPSHQARCPEGDLAVEALQGLQLQAIQVLLVLQMTPGPECQDDGMVAFFTESPGQEKALLFSPSYPEVVLEDDNLHPWWRLK